jgi:hypothetical protein
VLKGQEWCVGSVSGEAGESLKVRVRGAKVGRWSDFAAGGAIREATEELPATGQADVDGAQIGRARISDRRAAIVG